MKCSFVVGGGGGEEVREGIYTLGWKVLGAEDYSFSPLNPDQGFPLLLQVDRRVLEGGLGGKGGELNPWVRSVLPVETVFHPLRLLPCIGRFPS